MCHHIQSWEALTGQRTVPREAVDEDAKGGREAAEEREPTDDRDEFAEEHSPEPEDDERRPEPIGLA